MLYIVKTYNKKRIVIVVACIISVVLFTTVAVWHAIKFHNRSKIYSQYEVQYQKMSEVMKVQEIEKKKKQEQEQKQKQLPQYTEQGRGALANIYHSDKKQAYLTFDDGPSKSITTPILDVLKQENVKATFFVLGSRVELNPDIVKREYEEGHFVANHGYSHVYSSIYSSAQAALDEFNKTNDVVKNAIGVPEYNSHLFRFPGGSNGGKYSDLKAEAINLLDQNNIGHINWNALTEDAVGQPTRESMLQELKDTVGQKNVVVILMHDAGNKEGTLELLPEVIAYLREQGYEFKNFYDVMK